ncbi:hypothetical protein K6V90_26070, partial [Cupriavidus pauculus]
MTHENVGRASQATACSENAITAGKGQATVMDVTDELKSWGDGLPRSVTRLQPYHLKVLGANSAAGLS